MLANEQLRQTREDLAARSAEVQELRIQVAELEKLKAQQAQLIAMKDSDLAAAQKRLGAGQVDTGVPAWLWIGLALVIAGLLAFVLLRRRRGERPAPPYRGTLTVPPPIGNEPTPAPFQPAGAVPVADPFTPGPEIQAPRYTPIYAAGESTTGVVDAIPVRADSPAWTSTATARPAWHTVDGSQPVIGKVESSPASAPVVEPEPVVEPVTYPATVDADPVPAIAPSAGSRERLELAIAYLDLGDTEAARSLLQQVAAGDDPQARDEAGKLLRELG